jgi:SAM-dependent methyltransferase
MFMPEPARCLRQMREALRPGGRAAVAVWGPPDRNPFLALPMGIARKYYEGPPLPDATAPGGVFSFANRDKLRAVFEEAGFNDVHVEDMVLPMAIFDTGREFWEYCREFIGPLRRILETIPSDVQTKIGEEIATAAGNGDPNGKVSLDGNPIFGSGVK